MVNVSLDDLVPADHVYRHLERTLDLSFVRDLVRDRYSAFGHPSIEEAASEDTACLPERCEPALGTGLLG